MTGGQDLPVAAALVAIAALVLLVQGASAQQWSTFVTKNAFDQKFFPGHRPFYTYEGFKSASTVRQFSAFGNAGALADKKRELAAFLANVKHETGGLKFIYEQNAPKGETYCKKDTAEVRAKYPCARGKAYIGRGPLQLTWNYNYGDCGAFLKLDLLADPGLAVKDSATAFRTALWFWMTKGCHGKILGGSFSGTIRIINGMECGKPVNDVRHQAMLKRVDYYKSFCQILKVDPGADLVC